MIIEMNMPVPPEGFEYTGEYKPCQDCEYFLQGGVARESNLIGVTYDYGYFFGLRKLKQDREFKAGAFYPVIHNKDGAFDIAEYITEGTFNAFDTINYGRCSEDAFEWIGKELRIEWGVDEVLVRLDELEKRLKVMEALG